MEPCCRTLAAKVWRYCICHPRGSFCLPRYRKTGSGLGAIQMLRSHITGNISTMFCEMSGPVKWTRERIAAVARRRHCQRRKEHMRAEFKK